MSSNSEQIVQDIRAEFESLLDFVTGDEARTSTANHIERGLFKRLLALGAKLLVLFFVMRAQACSREPVAQADGVKLPYHSEKKRDYFSIFGKVPFWRPYFYQAGKGGESPLDAELSLPEDCYSDLLRESMEYLGVHSAYAKASSILQRLLHIQPSTRVLKTAIAEDAADVEAYYAQKPPPAADSEAEILVIQADGKGVPMVRETPADPKVRLAKGDKRCRKKEAIVTSVYTIAPAKRTPQEVVASFFKQTGASDPALQHPRPRNKHLWATLKGKDAALTRLVEQVKQRLGPHVRHMVALTDGCPALQLRILNRFPDFTLILDFIHANEYLWKVANSLLGEADPQRTQWVADQTLLMLSGRTEEVITTFRELAQAPGRTKAQRKLLTQVADYFQRNLPYMRYHEYLANGWPIASGVIEGACRHLVRDRCELSGMRWNQDGAEELLHLRCVAENGDWDDYHLFRRRQRHARLYHLPFPEQDPLEEQALELAA